MTRTIIVLGVFLVLIGAAFGIVEPLQRKRFREVEADVHEVLNALAKHPAGCSKGGDVRLLGASEPTDGRIEVTRYTGLDQDQRVLWPVSYRHSDPLKPGPSTPLLFTVCVLQKRNVFLLKPEVDVMLSAPFDAGIIRLLENELKPRGVSFRTHTD